MVLFMIVQPLALIVVILFWTLDKPIWQVCAINGGVQPCHDWPDYMGMFVHLYDFILLIGLFFAGNIPYYFSNSLWFVVFFFVYIGWTLIHFVFKIGRPEFETATCKFWGYSLDECPIYKVVDWHYPQKTLPLVFGIFVAGFIFIAIYRGFAWLRDHGGSEVCGSKDDVGASELESFAKG